MKTFIKGCFFYGPGDDDGGSDTSTAEEQGNVPGSDNEPTWQQ